MDSSCPLLLAVLRRSSFASFEVSPEAQEG